MSRWISRINYRLTYRVRIYLVVDALFYSDLEYRKEKLKFRTNLYELREDREMKPKTIASVISSMLYERRFGPYFVEPVIAGLQDGTPYLCAMDLIGAPVYTDDFVLAGTASEALYGLAESLWKPDLGPDELFEVISQTMLSATNRDCLSGWGARVYVLTEKSLVIKDLKGRQD